MNETISSSLKSQKTSRIEQDEPGRGTTLGVPVQSLGGDRIKKTLIMKKLKKYLKLYLRLGVVVEL